MVPLHLLKQISTFFKTERESFSMRIQKKKSNQKRINVGVTCFWVFFFFYKKWECPFFKLIRNFRSIFIKFLKVFKKKKYSENLLF